ncbi:MAG: hypothetical protein P8166_14205 [Candidatus Thiodiazotropha sp.]|jgi:hypothetical protein
MNIHNQIAYFPITNRTITLVLVILLVMPLHGCNLNSLQNDCATLDKSIADQEKELLDEFQIQMDEMKDMYFKFGFKTQFSMASIDALADPDKELVQLSNQYHETINALDALGPDECEKKIELSEKRVSLFKAKLDLKRKVLDERVNAIIEKTSDNPSR